MKEKEPLTIATIERWVLYGNPLCRIALAMALITVQCQCSNMHLFSCYYEMVFRFDSA